MKTSKIYTFANIKDLNISLSDLYENKKQINIHLSDNIDVFTLILSDYNKNPDCKISSFGANFWSRTNKGVNYQKYKNIGTLQTAIKKLINSKLLKVGEIRFSLSDEIFYI